MHQEAAAIQDSVHTFPEASGFAREQKCLSMLDRKAVMVTVQSLMEAVPGIIMEAVEVDQQIFALKEVIGKILCLLRVG